MKSRIIFLSLLLIVLLSINSVLIGMGQNNNSKENDINPLLYVANSIKGDILGYSIHGSVIIQEKITKRNMGTIMNEIVSNLGIDNFVFENTYIIDNETQYASVDWYYQKNYYKFIISQSGEKAYISLSVDLGKDVDVTNIYDMVENELIKTNSILNVNSSIIINTAVYKQLSGELTQNEIIEQIYLGFNSIGAKLISDYSGEGRSLGFLGYSTLLKNTVEVDGKKHNLHMAVYFDETIDQYYLTIANPIIETSY